MRRYSMALLAVVCLVSLAIGGKTAWDYTQEAAVYTQAQDTFLIIEEEAVPLAALPVIDTEPTQPQVVMPEAEVNPLEPHVEVDFEALQAVSGDAIAWLHLPNTGISYPLVQGEDNQYYVSASYDGKASSSGSIFMDYRVASDFSDENSILYGHNMKNDTMFGALQDYGDQAFATEHPYVFVLTQEGYLRYEVSGALYAESTSRVYTVDFAQTDWGDHLNWIQRYFLYETGETLTGDDQILTLSTCTGVTESQRFVLICRLVETVVYE